MELYEQKEHVERVILVGIQTGDSDPRRLRWMNWASWQRRRGGRGRQDDPEPGADASGNLYRKRKDPGIKRDDLGKQMRQGSSVMMN